MPVDQITDKNHAELYKLLSTVEAPEFVKEAALSDEEDKASLPKTAFADSLNRLYPIHTKADTWLSAAFYYKQASKRDETVEKQLEKAAQLWDVNIEGIKNALQANMDKQASESAPTYVVDLAFDGKSYAKIPVETPADLQKTAEYILNSSSSFPYAIRRDASRQILELMPKLQASFRADLEVSLQKTAGQGTCTVENAKALVKNRASLYKTRQRDLPAKLDEALTLLDKTASEMVPPPMLEKLASMLDAMDRLVNLHYKYAQGKDTFNAPEHALFQVTPRDIQDFKENAVVLSNGAVFSKQALQDNPLVKTLLSDVFNMQVKDAADMYAKLEAMPGKDADVVTEILER
jgi:hypothetical protein